MMRLLLVVLLAASGLMAAPCRADEVRMVSDFPGHYLNKKTMHTLLVEPVHIPDSFDDGTALGLYLVGEGQPEDKRAIVDPDVVNAGYDHVRVEQVCESPDTGLDIVMLIRGNSGTAWGDARNILFVYYDPAQGKFVSEDFEGRFVDQSCSPAAARLRQQQNEQDRQATSSCRREP